MSQNMNPVIHFEIPAGDLERVQKFYTNVFGWRTQALGPEMGGFVLAFTTETDENRIPKKVGIVNGGFYARRGADEHIKLTVLVPDIRAAMQAVERAGGRVVGGTQNPPEPDEMPGIGLFVNIVDPEGNCITLHEDRSGVTPPGWDEA
jgi:predicted enzyme related to lactoylglutathione lyase